MISSHCIHVTVDDNNINYMLHVTRHRKSVLIIYQNQTALIYYGVCIIKLNTMN